MSNNHLGLFVSSTENSKIDNFDMMLLHDCVVLPLVGSIHKPLGNMGEQTVNSFACGCLQQPIVATVKDT